MFQEFGTSLPSASVILYEPGLVTLVTMKGLMDKSLLLVFVVPCTPAASLVPLQHLVVLSILDCRTAVSVLSRTAVSVLSRTAVRLVLD